MAQLSEVQRTWVNDFLRNTSRAETTRSSSLAQALNQIVPTTGVKAEPRTGDTSRARIATMIGGRDVLVAGPSQGGPILPHSGSGASGNGDGGDTGPGGNQPSGGTEGGTRPSGAAIGRSNPSGGGTVEPPTTSTNTTPSVRSPSSLTPQELEDRLREVNAEIEDLSRQLRENPNRQVVNDLLEGAEKGGGSARWRPPQSERELVDRIERVRKGGDLKEQLGKLGDWNEISRRLREAVARARPLERAQKELDRRERKRTEARERIGLFKKPESHQPMVATHSDPNTPKVEKGAGKPITPSPVPSDASGARFDLARFQTDATKFIRLVEENKKAIDELQRKLEQSKSISETEKLRTKLGEVRKGFEAKSRIDSENLKKQLATAPEMAGIAGATPGETFSKASKVDVVAKRIGPLLAQLQDAYEMVESIKHIFAADTAMEGMIRTAKLGKDIAVGSAEFALARYISGSSAVGWAVVGLVTMPNDQGAAGERRQRKANRQRAKEVAVGKYLEKSVPGSVVVHKDKDGEWVEAKDQKLWKEVLKQVDQMRREQLALQAKEKGIKDGLVATITSKNKFEPKEEDEEDLGITQKDLLRAYQEGIAEGKARREATIKRAHKAGFDDGKKGKASSFEAVKQWPELRILKERPIDKLSDDEFKNFEMIFFAYSDSYDKGYEEGRIAGKALVITKLEITPNGFTMGAHTMRRLAATAVFSNQSSNDMSGEVSWRSSDDNVVNILLHNGVAHAAMRKPGRADITASYSGIHGSKDARISIVVNPPAIVIRPANATMKVGEQLRFLAYSVDKANDGLSTELDSSVISWVSDDQNRVAIDSEGNVTTRAAGKPVNIYATYKGTPAQVNTTVTVR